MLLTPVYGVADDIASRFAKHELLRRAADLLRDRLRADHFDHMVIEKWHPSLDRVRHLHAVAQHGQDIRGQPGFGPQIERLVERISSGELTAYVNASEEGTCAVAFAE